MQLPSEYLESSIASRVASIIETNPDNVAILDENITISYYDLHIRAQLLSQNPSKPGLHFTTSKIEIIIGDFSQPKLGLAKTANSKLASSISAICHLGAQVNYNQPYSNHRAANGIGTFNILEFTSAQRPKAFHYTSRLAAFGPAGLVEKNSTLVEGNSLLPHLEHSLPFEGGYGQTIYRLGFVLCHCVSGTGNPNDFMGRLLSDCAELGVCPLLPDQRKELIAADNVAKIIKTISMSDRNLGHVYHITSGLGKPIDMNNTFQLLSKLWSVEMRALPYPEWIKYLHRANKEGKSLRLQSLFPVL
ncbi:non-ribosomal peptide synthetase [Trichoderma arundinaceum]|uniref:Non-ribosomal peptide synthetase n=1 Tax=Trichoderma arundinaceum TaxID=490622 RepID=A0A395NWA1_TRIAR|nr:non-ribosomal peptide synthetase [Trichoderma arundinaceum]